MRIDLILQGFHFQPADRLLLPAVFRNQRLYFAGHLVVCLNNLIDFMIAVLFLFQRNDAVLQQQILYTV